MTLTTIAFNGTDIESLGLVLVDETGLRDVVKRNRPTVTLPLVPGQRSLSVGSTLDPRRAPLRFDVKPTSFTDRQSKLDALVAMFPDPVAVTRVDSPNRACMMRLEQMPISTPFKIYATLPIYGDLTLIGDDPYYYDTTAVTQSITAGSAGTLSMGTAPLHKLLFSIAPCTNPVVILRDQSSNELARMTFTGTIPGGKTLDVDCTLGPTGHTVILNSGGVDHLDWLGQQDDFFLPRLGQGVTSVTLECAQANLSLTYYRSYEN